MGYLILIWVGMMSIAVLEWVRTSPPKPKRKLVLGCNAFMQNLAMKELGERYTPQYSWKGAWDTRRDDRGPSGRRDVTPR